MLPNGSIARSPLSPSMKAGSAGWMSLNSLRSPKRLKQTPAHCSRTFFAPTSLCPLRSKIADQGAPEHRQIRCPFAGWSRRVRPPRTHAINISLWVRTKDRYRDRHAAQLRSIRKRDGVVPVSLRKLSVKWLWLAKPTEIAISAIDCSAPSKSSFARRMRRSIR